MQGVQRPIFLVGYGPFFITDTESNGSVNAFGTRSEAEVFAREAAKQKGGDVGSYRIARYDYTGDITEVRK